MGKSETPQLDQASFLEVKKTVKESGIDVKDKVQMSDANIVMKVNKAWADKYKDHPLSKKIQGFALADNAEEAVQKIKELQKQLGLKGNDIDGIMGFKTAGLYEKRDTKKEQDEAKKILDELEGVQKKDKKDRLDIDTTADGSSSITSDGIQLAQETQEERTKKLTELGDKAKNIDQTKFKVTEVDPEGNPLQYNSQLKAWVGSEGDTKDKVLNTDTGEYNQTVEQVLAENKTKSEKEATGKKVEGLLGSIDATITESEPGDTNDVIQKFLSQIPENGLSESQLAHLNNSLKERGFKIAPYNDEDHYANGIESHYFIEETGFGPKKDYEDQLAKIEGLGNDPKKYLDWSVEGKGDGKTGLLKNKTLGELTPELVNGKNNSSMPEQVRKEILALVDITKNNPELKNITFQEYLETIKDSNKAALALAPTDKPGFLPGKLGEWGVKYQKKGDIAIKLGEDDSLKSIITKEGETPLDTIGSSDLMKTRTLLDLPNDDVLKKDSETGTIRYYAKKDLDKEAPTRLFT